MAGCARSNGGALHARRGQSRVEHLGARHGLVELGRWRAYGEERGEPVSDEVLDRIARMGRASGDAWHRVIDEPMLAAGHGLYEWRPRFRSRPRNASGSTPSAAKSSPSPRVRVRALAIINRPWLDAERRLRPAFLAGTGEAVLDLLIWLGRPPIRFRTRSATPCRRPPGVRRTGLRTVAEHGRGRGAPHGRRPSDSGRGCVTPRAA